jgi:hypothetical protein
MRWSGRAEARPFAVIDRFRPRRLDVLGHDARVQTIPRIMH